MSVCVCICVWPKSVCVLNVCVVHKYSPVLNKSINQINLSHTTLPVEEMDWQVLNLLNTIFLIYWRPVKFIVLQ